MVLALKYRPKQFSELVGQEAVIQTLKNALDNKKLANAYLFSGLRGSGKTSTARIFAKALQCEKGETSEPCEVCENCIMANENRHIDIIEMDAASNRKIEDIKDIIEQTRYKPTIGKYKIFIIDEAHMLTREAENALLKTLEEPPPYVKFILATTDPLKLPVTILSRTQHYRFTKIDNNLIKNHLETVLAKENVKYETKAIELIAKSGNGSLRDTLTLLNQAIAYSKGNIKTADVVEMLGIINPEIIDNIFQIIFNLSLIHI
jgi:DNA polymerase-3 subunit gamma/tau